jgi:hypothetical protein
MKIGQRIDRALSKIEWRWSLGNLLGGAYLFLSAALPAWAVSAMSMFQQYAPLSWVFAGFAGLSLSVLCFATYSWAYLRIIRARYDSRLYERSGFVDPMAKTFENRRIHLSDFVLPSTPLIAGKAFINCEIIGPANLLFRVGNSVAEQKLPFVDGWLLRPDVKNFYNCIVIDSCTFRECSFKLCTLVLMEPEYQNFSHLDWINWLNAPGTEAMLPGMEPAATLGLPPSPPLPPSTEAEK